MAVKKQDIKKEKMKKENTKKEAPKKIKKELTEKVESSKTNNKKENKTNKCTKKQIIIISVISTVCILGALVSILLLVNKEETKQKETCSVNFNTNGGLEINEINLNCGNTIEEPETPVKSGFEFLGWYINDKEYNFNSKIEKNIILEAKWKAKEDVEIVIVSFDTDGGSKQDNIELEKGTYLVKPLDPTKKGYSFVGWYLNGKEFSFVSNTIDKNIKLKAKWKKNANEQSNDVNDENSVPSDNANSSKDEEKGYSVSWEQMKGTWYLTGTDEVFITFSESNDSYKVHGTKFEWVSPSPINPTGGQGAGALKTNTTNPVRYMVYEMNITSISKDCIEIDKKYKFYKTKNYPTRIPMDWEKFANNIEGTWYLSGYDKDVYVSFKSGTRNGEKVVWYDEHNFCASYGTVYPSSCYGSDHFNYYSIADNQFGIASKGWKHENGYLYNSSGSTKLKFSKNPTKTLVTSVELSKKTLNLSIGDNEILEFSISPNNATNKGVTWTSSDTNVATVSSNGKVTAKGRGTATITIKTTDGGYTDECIINVSAIGVTSITLNKNNLSMIFGDKEKLIATITPSNATNKNIIWTSSNTSVARVTENGEVIAKGKGVTKITATTEDGSLTASCNVEVEWPELIVNGSLGVQTTVSNSGATQGLLATISATGGSGSYNYYYITIHKDNQLIGSTKNVYSNELFIEGYTNGTYTMNYEVRDTSGVTKKGTKTVTINGF